MKALTYLSSFMIPFLMFYIVGYGLLSKRDIYRDFLKGTEDGLRMVMRLCPTLIGLMTAVGVLRASGFLDFCGAFLGNFTEKIGMPAEIVPLAVVRLFSSSGATGLLLDIFKEFGTDSLNGLMGGILLSSTESVFYCMSVYFGSVQIEKTRYTLAGALFASLAGIIVSVILAHLLV
ncbi:MAG: spore maturation protein [Eubacteriales bacterium]|nr:spore maturation protein [Eubacteriales bacterium]